MSRTIRLLIGCTVVGVMAGAVVSRSYWGYPFGRPSIPEVAQATRVLSVTSMRVAKQGDRCTLEVELVPDLRQHLAGMRRDVDDFPDIRALVGLGDRGLLPTDARAPAWLDPAVLYQAVADAGILVRGEAGYDTAGCFGGYAIELSLPPNRSRLLLTAAGPEVSNDHHPFYEVVFRREGTHLIPERKRVTFFDIAGIEGFEWPLLHAAFVVLCLAVGLGRLGDPVDSEAVGWLDRAAPPNKRMKLTKLVAAPVRRAISWVASTGGERMKRLGLAVGLLCCGAISPGSPASPGPATGRVTIQRAIDLAIVAVGDRPATWDQGCDIRVRAGKADWSVDFEPIPKRPGLDVMVIVHADGSTTVTPY